MRFRMKILYLGQMKFEKYRLVKAENQSKMIISPMVSILIQHPILGNVLYDTGNDDNWMDTYGRELNSTFPVIRYKAVVDSLSDNGLTPDDIDILIVSRLHFDHAGGLKFFTNTKSIKEVVVSEADLKEAFELTSLTPSGIYGRYVRKTFANIPDISFKPIDGTHRLAKDLTLFVQKVHNAGCIGLRLDFKNNGTIIVCGGAIYTAESFADGIREKLNLNRDAKEFLDNVHMLQYMKKKYNASIFFGHDYEQVIEWQNVGWID